MPRSTTPTPTSRRTLLCAAGAWLPLRAMSRIPELRLRLSHVVSENTPKGLAALRFQTLLLQRSQGRIVVDIYPGASLYGDHDEIEALRSGAVEMLAPSLSKLGRVGLPEFEVFDLPYLFRSLDDVRRVTNGPIGQWLLDDLRRQDMVGLGFLDNGFKHMSAIRPLHAPGDFQGLRMRVQQGSEVIAAQMRALGAYPVALPFTATAEALARGIVQGTENPLSNFWTQGMHRVQPHLSLTQHGYLGYVFVAGDRFWSSLSRTDQQLVRSCLAEALIFGNQIAGAQDAQAFAQLQVSGQTRLHQPTEPQRQLLSVATQPVYDQLARRIGARWINDVRTTARG
ncbi:DctP family TRAP transporter solute-binding subunit [Hydrogenophaga aquatica]